jgi:XTP/dITP diphosphohydrolase
VAKISEQRFVSFVEIVRRLRNECPWDREQTHESIRQSLIEEAYEVIEAIDASNMDELKLELGDLMLHVALHSIMAEEEKAFTIEDVLTSVSEKLVRRHPHVFGTTKAKTSREVKANWEKMKLTEGRTSVVDGIPKELPALLRAHRMQERASKIGFDWTNKEDVWKKVQEEIRELEEAEQIKGVNDVEAEFGDLLFALVNYARFLHVNPEIALRKSNAKFEKRFRGVEKELRSRGKQPAESTLEEMDEIWNRIKER